MQDRREPEDSEGDEAHLHGIRPEQRSGIGRTDELDEEDAKAEGAECGRGDMPAPGEPATQETARVGEGAAHPDVGPTGGVRTARSQLRICRPDDQGRGWIHASDFETVFAIRSPRVRKRSSTFSPVFAEL